MAAKDPEGDVVTFLAGELAALNASGSSQNIGKGPVRAPASNVPKICVFVMSGRGRDPMRAMSQTSEHRWPIVHVTVRHTKHDEGNTLMQDIIDSMRGASISGYLDVSALGSAPNSLPPDKDGNHLWIASFLLPYEQA